MRYCFSIARRKALEALVFNEKKLDLPAPARQFLHEMCFDAMIMDLATCWDGAKASIPTIARKLERQLPEHRKSYVGEEVDLQFLKSVTAVIADLDADIRPKMKSVFFMRDKQIAHLDGESNPELERIDEDVLNQIQVATMTALEELNKLTPSFIGYSGATMITEAGALLVNECIKVLK